MNMKHFLEFESKSLRKLQKCLLLPNYFKTIGIVGAIISLVAIVGLKYFMVDSDTAIFISSRVLLISLLTIAISREKIEDELIVSLRLQAYTFAFVSGVVYAIFQPIVNLLVASAIKPEKAEYEDMTVFVVLWFMLFVQLCFFHLLKRTT